MVHQLELPLPLAGFQVDRDYALSEQIVAGPMPAVKVRARRLDRQVDETQLLVDRHLVPDAGVAVERPRILLPGVVAEFTGFRNRVEVPQPLAGADVEGLDDTLRIVVRPRGMSFAERHAD